MAISFVSNVFSSTTTSLTLSFSSGGASAPTLAVSAVTIRTKEPTGTADPTSVTYAGSSMTKAVDLDRQQPAAAGGAYKSAGIYHVLSPVSGVQTLSVTAPGLLSDLIQITASITLYDGGGALNSFDSDFDDGGLGDPTPSTSSTLSIVSNPSDLVYDCIFLGSLDPTAGTGQTLRMDIGGQNNVEATEKFAGASSPTTMSYTWSSAQAFLHVGASYTTQVVGGFGGVEFTPEGAINRPQEPGFPGAPAFPGFGVAAASPYDLLKKGIQVEALLNNAKFI